MLYYITSFREGEDGPMRKDTRRRSDAADAILYSHLYQALEDQGLLDTPAQGKAVRDHCTMDYAKGGTIMIGNRMIVVTASKGGA